MLNMLKSLICLIAAEPCSAVSHGQTIAALTTSYAWIVLKNVFMSVWNFILSMIWVIEKFILGIMDALQTIVFEFLGIGTTIDDYLNFVNKNEATKTLVITFRAILVVAIVLMIIFTIIAIIRQEIEVATNAKNSGSEEANKKGPIVMKLFKGIMSAILLPFAMIAIIGAVNAVLTSFNNALQGENQSTIAGQVLATSSYDTNKYRQYANNNKRVPVIIQAYNVNDYATDQRDQLFKKIKSLSVQQKLINTATDIDKNLLLSFNNSLSYENNKLTNSSAYADYYENFVCTAEQYQVMADFIDFCELTNTNFYIKAIDDNDIEWKYVDTTIFDSKNMSLNITYRDANDLDCDGKTNDTYTVTFSMGFDVTSPISNALKSISALLGLNEFGDMSFNEMDRDKNSINLVQWANEKVSLHFSQNFNVNDMNSWTPADEILMYEFYHYASNNTLSEFDFSDLSFENRGNVTLDAYKILYRDYYPDAGAFSSEKVIYCVYINGSYYKVKKSETEADGYGNKYYVLEENKDTHFLEKAYTILSEEPEKALLKFEGKQGSFNLNNPSTWSYTDQIIIYEYYKDLSYSNTLSDYSISDFSKGIEVPTYIIKDYDANGIETQKRYVLINGTYYAVSSPSSGSHYVLTGSTSGTNFLESIEDRFLVSYYNYAGSNGGAIKLEDPRSEFGISTNANSNKTANDFIIDSDDGPLFENLESSINYIFDEDVSFNLHFSAGFDYKDVDTWSYKDYFLFYLYAKYLTSSGLSVENLKYTNLPGTIGKYNGKYYFKIQSVLTENNTKFKTVYISVNDVDIISTQNIKNVINAEKTFENNRFSTNDDTAFTYVSDPSTIFSKTETETKVFTFSSDVSFENVNAWKMRDYILFLLDSRGIIRVPSIFTYYEYNSVCYKGVNIGNGLTTTLYGFGNAGNNENGNNDERIYLNEKYLLGLGYESIDEFLDTKLLTFIAKKLTTSTNGEIQKLLLESEEIISSIANSNSYNGNTHMLSSLAHNLINLYGLKISSADKLLEIYSDITKYTYSNPNFKFEDLSTYTMFDLALYLFTGSATGRYENYIANVDGELKYIIGNYAISITKGSLFESNLVQRGTLTSGLINVTTSLVDYYNSNNLSEKVIKIKDSENRLTRADNINYIYNSDISNNNYTALDSILEALKLAKISSFELYTDGVSNYILLGNNDGISYYVEVNSFNFDSTVMLSKEATISLNSSLKPFIQSTIHTTNYNSVSSTSNKISYIDSAIFELTKSLEDSSYNVFISAILGAKSYIYVAGRFIEYNSDVIDLNSQLSAGYDDYVGLINSMVNNYYGSYVVGNIGSTTSSKEFNYSVENFNIESITTYSPLKLILYRLGLINSTKDIISGTLTKSLDGSKLYFVIKSTDDNGIENTYNINVTEFLDEDGNEKTDKIKELKLRATLCYKTTGGGFILPSQAIENLTTLKTNIQSAIDKYVSVLSPKNILDFTSQMTEEDLSTWNYLDIVYYYLFGAFRETDEFLLYSGVGESGEKDNLYVKINYGSATKFIKFSDSLLTDDGTTKLKTFDKKSEEVEFSLTQDCELIDLLYFKYTGLQKGSVNYIEFEINGNIIKVYSIEDKVTAQKVYYICDKEQSINSVVSKESYSYTVTATTENLKNWRLLDLIIKAAEGNTQDKGYTFSSKIYTIDSMNYIFVNGYYINLDLAGATIPKEGHTITSEKSPLVQALIGYSANAIDSGSSDENTFAFGFIKLSDNNISKISSPLVKNPETGEVISSNEVKLYFSEGFVYSDYSTWKNSDFILYYLFTQGHMNADIKSFQYYVNLGYVPATKYALESYDKYGNITINVVYKVGEGECNFGSFANLNANSIEDYKNSNPGKYAEFINGISDYKFINANIWNLQYQRQLKNISVSANPDADLTVNVSDKPITNPGIGSFGFSVTSEVNAKDFLYENYYYFNVNNDSSVLQDLLVDTSISDKLNDSASTDFINLKLSAGFNINDINSWTILDYIIIKEYARDHSEETIFRNCTFEELKQDLLVKIYVIKGTEKDNKYLKINGYYYNITNALSGVTGKLAGAVSKSNIAGINNNTNYDYSYDFRVSADELLFNLSLSKDQISRELTTGNDNLIYDLKVAEKKYTYHRKVDKNLERVFRVNLRELDTYTISVIVKEVNWVQKLMNDMQVLYPDLNWANLIATNGWLDTLGDYHSSYASGEFIGSGNTANITSAGLVLSEFLLTIAETSYAGFADYEYSSVFDEEVINSLMLTMLGEKDYENVKTQAKVFVEMFNVGFAEILDDVAADRGLNIKDGEVSNLTMSVYKSYLASILLSSDLGEYLYTIATRVYAQYAIYETLAFASGDYANYIAYINGFADENGDKINAFKYATFRELVQFENTSLKADAVPVYSFNYFAVYRSLIKADETDFNIKLSLGGIDVLSEWVSKISGKTIEDSKAWLKSKGYGADYDKKDLEKIAKEFGQSVPDIKVFDEVIKELKESYKTKYLGHRGSTDRFDDNDQTRFSYMFHVYYSIRQDLNNRMILSQPTYLRIYEDYIDGKIDRWVIESDISIDASSNYIQNYDLYKLMLGTKKMSYIASYIGAFFPNMVITPESEEDLDEIEETLRIGDYSVDIDSLVYRLKSVFPSTSTYGKILNQVFASDSLKATDIIDKFKLYKNSEKGSQESWDTILKTRDNIEALLSELSEVMFLSAGEKTPNGSVHANFSSKVYNNMYNELSKLSEKLNDYITTQNMLDKIEKGSITFTLAQFSNNYVESGFEFTIKNKRYKLDTAISTQRLAEYVYGGAYLTQFGVYPQYTSSTFTGIIHPTKAVDPKDGLVKTKLNCFTELRKFAGNIADYTAKLYFLTNLKDLSNNVSDSMLLTEELYSSSGLIGNFFGNNNSTYKTSLEYLILDHIVADEELSPETLLRLIFGDSEDSLNRMGCTDESILKIAKYLNGSVNKLTEEELIIGLRRYLVYIQTTDSKIKTIDGNGYTYLAGTDIEGYFGLYMQNGYNSHGYYSDGTNTASERMHKVFKNVMSYLTISNEQSEGDIDLGIEGIYESFDGMTFKDLKSFLTKALVDYKQNESETGAENASRYLTLFNLVSGEFNYYITDGQNGQKNIGRTLSSINKHKEEGSNVVQYKDDLIYQGTDYGARQTLYAKFGIDRSTRGTILKLCGIENRPIEELVNLEYDKLYERNGSYDEANGDVFVVCSYDEVTGKYVPFLASNRKYSGTHYGTNYMDYLNDYGYRIYTDYYDSASGTRFAYPIIAKGIITSDLKPTAIKIEDNVAKFYRSDITATSKIEDTALQTVNASVETSTVGYVKYVNVSSFNNIQAEGESKTMFIGSSNVMSFIKSDANVFYVQYTNVYNLAKADGFDGISVLDSFSAFFNMSIQMHLLMVLAFITLIPLLFKASGAVLKRVLDLIFLVLAGPLCISMNSLKHTDEEQQAYSSWKKYMFSTLLSVFGLIISFNLYFIMVSSAMNMTFVEAGDSTMQKLSMIGGLSFVTAPILNAFLRIVFVVIATNMIETAADMLLGMITGGKASSSFGSPLAEGKNAIDSIVDLKNNMVSDIKKVTSGARDIINGKILVEAKNALVDSLPGSQLVRGAVEGVGNMNNYIKSKQLYNKARQKGVGKIAARAASKEFRNNYKKQREQINNRRKNYTQSFYGRMGMK